MAKGLPEEANAIGDRRKTTETGARSPLSTVYACTDRLPPKHVWPRLSTNQIIALPARAQVLARATAEVLRVYKPSKAVSKPFGLGLAQVRFR